MWGYNESAYTATPYSGLTVTGRQAKRGKKSLLGPKKLKHQVEEERKERKGRARGLC